jgi:hypothetical protein
LGVASATSVNKLTLTAPTTSATLTIVDGSTLATSGAFSQTHTTTAATNVTYPAGTSSNYLISSATQLATNPVTGTPSSTTYLRGDGTWSTVNASAGGSTTQVQYNNAGVLAGITGATTNGTALTLVAPILGTPASVTLTNATGLPIATGLSGLTTNGVAYASSTSALTTGSALTFDGTNLGVGTSSPTAKLTVSTTTNNGEIRVSDNATYYGSLSRVNATDEVRLGSYGPSQSMTFYTVSSEKMRLDSSGNLLVGATSALTNTKLDVRGLISSGATYGGSFSVYDTLGASQVGYFSSDAQVVANNDTNVAICAAKSGKGIKFYTSGANERMRIDSSGIVTMFAYGVGTATFSSTGVISSVSDETWKIKDGTPVDPDSMLKKLEPGYWYYNEEKREIFGTDRQLGFYAQNVNNAIGPEAAPQPEEGKPWGYYDRSVLAVVVMSLQKALATIETLENRITALENK